MQSCRLYSQPPDPVDIQHWHAHGQGKHTFLHGHRLFGEKDTISRKQEGKEEMTEL